jgi:hypothetical protein
VDLHRVAGLLVITAFCGQSQDAPAPLNLNGILVQCSNESRPRECHNSQVAMRLALEAIRPALRDWRFVVVPDNRWAQTCATFRLERCVLAFSHLGIRATYLNSRLANLVEGPHWDEELARFTPLTGMPRLEWVLGHELGHILCGTAAEDIAEDAGNRMRRSSSHEVTCLQTDRFQAGSHSTLLVRR